MPHTRPLVSVGAASACAMGCMVRSRYGGTVDPSGSISLVRLSGSPSWAWASWPNAATYLGSGIWLDEGG